MLIGSYRSIMDLTGQQHTFLMGHLRAIFMQSTLFIPGNKRKELQFLRGSTHPPQSLASPMLSLAFEVIYEMYVSFQRDFDHATYETLVLQLGHSSLPAGGVRTCI